MDTLIYGTLCAKNEEDILPYILESTLTWIDKLFVIDNGSDDSTPEIFKRAALDDSRICYLGQILAPFTEGYKSIAVGYVQANPTIPDPDWWAIVDSDEVYPKSPRSFIENVPERYGQVATDCFEFSGYLGHGSPIKAHSYKYVTHLDWAETRFFRNSKSASWASYNDNGMSGCRAAYPKRIQIHHFPLRTEHQVAQRIIDRNTSRANSKIPWHNSKFKSAADALARYSSESRQYVRNQNFEEKIPAKNFYSTWRHYASSATKQGLHFLGLM